MNSTPDQYETPKPVFDKLHDEFNFLFDVCAQDETAKCPYYWTEKDDALSKKWHSDPRTSYKSGGYLWCNPPYSNITPWVEKAIEAQLNGRGTVMLVMADPSVKWFSLALSACSEVRFIINGRLAFHRDGKPVSGNNKGSVIFVFDPHRIGWAQTRYVDRADLLK